MTWTWLLVASGIVGVLLNNYRRKECFIIWGIGNITWAVVDWRYGLYSQSVLMGIYFLLAIHGWYKWGRN
ncbi:MAG: nicotinamide mononucleotide transporter [Syntrophorhabdaceae bacterium]